MSSSCTCATCRSACHEKPGWFLPGEAERAAELMGVPFHEFFERYLGVDWYEADGMDPRVTRDTFVLAPGIVGEDAGTEYPGDPSGRCVFLDESERCRIYGARPHECAEYHHSDRYDVPSTRHADVALAWVEHQGQITALLGREPEAAEYEGGSIFDMILGRRW